MKYWLLTTEYPPFYGGGISTYCYFTARMLAGKGHTVTVFVPDGTIPGVHEQRIEGSRIVRFHPSHSGTSANLGYAANLSHSFAQVLKTYIGREGAPGCIEAQEYLGIAYYVLNYRYLRYAWCQDIPIVITTHSPAFLYLHYNHVPTYQFPEYWIGEMEKFCLQAADAIISPSYYLVERIREFFPLSNSNISVIANPFEANVNRAERNGERNNRIVFYGKLSAQKGTFKLLQYFESMWASGFPESLHLYGGQDIVYHPEGKTMGTIVKERHKSSLAAGRLLLYPKMPPAQIASALGGAQLVIVPSTVDNFPYVVLEMMGLGNIVLVSKQGGQSEIVQDGINGFVFDHDKKGDFERQVLRVMNLAEANKTTIRQNAAETVERKYNLEAIYSQKWPLIEKLSGAFRQADSFPFIRQLAPPTPLTSAGNKLLSIVIPYYNMGRYIEETIAAVRSSTYAPKEIIIVNDGSTESASLEVLERLRRNGDLKVIDTPNNGLAQARNRGAQEGSGQYLAFLDADDTVAADYYTKAIAVLADYSNVYFVGCWTQYFDGSQKSWPTFTPELPIILFQNTINSSALVYKRSAYLQAGLNDAAMPFTGLEDYDSVLSLLAKGYRGVVLPEKLFYYRVRKNSMIRAITATKKRYLVEYITRKHLKLYATFAAEITGLLQANGPGIFLDNPSADRSYLRNSSLNRVAKKALELVKRQPLLKKVALTIYRKIKS